MKVICINDDEQHFDPEEGDLPTVQKGHIYNVVEIHKEKREETASHWHPAGFYYEFVETGNEAIFHESLFVTIIEDQQDEKEFERNYIKEPINQ